MRVAKVFVLSLMWLQVQGQEPTQETPTTTPTTSETSETTPTPSPSSTTSESTPATSEISPKTSESSPTTSETSETCDSSFKVGEEMRDTHFIAAIVNSVMDKLRSNNVKEEQLAKIPTIIGGNLYCDGNLPDTIDIMLAYLYDNVDRDCFKITGYQSVYIKSE
ncbi:probable transcription-associated protein 1 [Drosophila sulfurigaster albostrigata]|uniref:probable transcription-associated protein 1 n=1 Tax=Drosophila sulfurigaster albostrigata TaxID=89887 RepID=UPI002D21BC2F|nr:probable transcription-associated protein 1 [Drosophila sulfurigaster albostrigata]